MLKKKINLVTFSKALWVCENLTSLMRGKRVASGHLPIHFHCITYANPSCLGMYANKFQKVGGKKFKLCILVAL